MSSDARPVGLTKDVGFEIGVSRTVDGDLEDVWALLMGQHGVDVWLGPRAVLGAEPGDRFAAENGTTGELRSRHERDRVRVTYQPSGRSAPSTVQLTVRSAARAGRTSVRFHQERLATADEREAQRAHWSSVLDQIESMLGG